MQGACGSVIIIVYYSWKIFFSSQLELDSTWTLNHWKNLMLVDLCLAVQYRIAIVYILAMSCK